MISLPATLTEREASEVMTSLVASIAREPGGPVEVDAAPLTRFDSTALAVLLELHRQAAGRGAKLILRQVPQRLADLAKLYGVADVLLAGAGTAAAQ